MFDSLLLALGWSKATAVPGFFGSALSLAFFKDLSAAGKLGTFIGGMCAANYLPRPVITWFKLIPPEDYFGGLAFVLGFLSMSLAAAAIKVIVETDWIAFVKVILGRGANKGGDQS